MIRAIAEAPVSGRDFESPRPENRLRSEKHERSFMVGSSKKPSLTRRQREIYEFLREKIINRGYGPTVREIGLHFNIRSPNGVMCHLKALERKGLISREQNMSRAIQLADAPQNRLSVPLMGTALSGRPVQPTVAAAEEHVSFNTVFEGNEMCCLRVEGHAFNPLHISDGDYLLLNRDAPMQAGSLVAALDDRHCVVICRVQEGGSHLEPAIPGAYSSVTRQVLGVITGVVRKFRVAQRTPADNSSPNQP